MWMATPTGAALVRERLVADAIDCDITEVASRDAFDTALIVPPDPIQGAATCITKPLDIAQMLELIEHVLRVGNGAATW